MDVTTIDTALTSVSNARASLGAVQNRLEHTIANLGVYQENLSASERASATWTSPRRW